MIDVYSWPSEARIATSWTIPFSQSIKFLSKATVGVAETQGNPDRILVKDYLFGALKSSEFTVSSVLFCGRLAR